MTEAEWNTCDDAGAMLDFLWQQFGVSPTEHNLRFGGDMRVDPPEDALARLNRALHPFYVASCRRIWKLLPQEESRRGVELTERFLAGEVSREEINKYEWDVEGAAFCIDYNTRPKDIKRWVAEVRALPNGELRSLLHPPEAAAKIDPRELLKQAAYFVDYSMVYTSLRPNGPPPPAYRPFLSAAVLRQHVSYPKSS